MDDKQRTASGSANGNGNGNGEREPKNNDGGRERAPRRHDARGERGERVVSRSARALLREAETRDEEDAGLAAEEGLMAMRDALEQQIRERPYTTLACAVGAGVLLGQALSTRVGRVALLAAGGYAATRFLRGDGMQALSNLLGEDIDDEDPEEIPGTRDVHG